MPAHGRSVVGWELPDELGWRPVDDGPLEGGATDGGATDGGPAGGGATGGGAAGGGLRRWLVGGGTPERGWDGTKSPRWSDPWGVLGLRVGEPVRYTYEGSDADGRTSAVPQAGAAPAPAAGGAGGRAHRRAPTLRIERRALDVLRDQARKWMRDAPREADGILGRPEHRTDDIGPASVTMLSGPAWTPAMGPDVRVVAVLLPHGAGEALVLTLDWDDEAGLDALVGLAGRLASGIKVELEPVESRAGRRAASVPVPDEWVGTRSGGAVAVVARGLTRVSRVVVGRAGTGRAAAWVWGVMVLFVVVAMNRDRIGDRFIDDVMRLGLVICAAVPTLLAWRAWTVVHGLARWNGPRVRGSHIGFWYLAGQALLGAAMLFLGGTDVPWWVDILRVVIVASVVAFLVLDRARNPLARALGRLLERRAARSSTVEKPAAAGALER